MAGLYVDAPGFKMQYDVDGSAGFIESGAALSGAQLIALNDETSTNVTGWGGTGTLYTGIIFPELRDLTGVWWCVPDQSFVTAYTVSTSPDTTNGVDGTWTSRSTAGAAGAMTFRSSIAAITATSVKAIRAGITSVSTPGGSRYLAALHIYGAISAGQSLDRLRLWHPTLDAEVGYAYFDYGDFGRGGTIDKTFRVKNNSSSLTASSIVLSTAAPTDTTPAVLSQMSLSQGGSFASTQNIGALAPGAISAVCTLRIASLSTNTLGIWRQRLAATAGSWA